MKSTFGYTIRPTTALLLQPADYELRHVFRWHSGTKANARYPKLFLRELTKQDPTHLHRTNWFETNTCLSRIPAETLALAASRFQQIKSQDTASQRSDALDRLRTTGTHGTPPGRYQRNYDNVLYKGSLGFGATSPSRCVTASLKHASPNFNKTYGCLATLLRTQRGEGLAVSSAVPGLTAGAQCMASLPYYQTHDIQCRYSTLTKTSIGWQNGELQRVVKKPLTAAHVPPQPRPVAPPRTGPISACTRDAKGVFMVTIN
mmetsp:Transcript_7857/g.11568  ORF Transcript_7857/g.11568 Transcript_7857/m.11568 type:complete len:260 (+) Transcript_7857:92-871(+)